MSNILVVDDEQEFLSSIRRALLTNGHKPPTLIKDPTAVASLLEGDIKFDVAVIDITMPVMSGIEVLAQIKRISPLTECVMITARDEARLAVQCLKEGAYDYLVKPIGADDFLRVLERALERKRLIDIVELGSKRGDRPIDNPAFHKIITRSSKMYRLLREAELHAASEIPVLISGETGTGKELLAFAIHQASSRAKGPFSPINMAALSSALFESAFFGHVKGAFTGAQNEHKGFLEASASGTLFLDEIGTLGDDLQGKLLRVLQEKEFIKLGCNRPCKADVRCIAATNADLQQLMGAGHFRKDLYYRLRGAQLHLPPLRERKEDIPLLVEAFVAEYCGVRPRPEMSSAAMSILMSYDYPGNIRELRAILQAAINLASGRAITPAVLPAEIGTGKDSACVSSAPKAHAASAKASLAEVEKQHIEKTFRETKGNLTHTARSLGISLNTLRKKLDAYGISRK